MIDWKKLFISILIMVEATMVIQAAVNKVDLIPAAPVEVNRSAVSRNIHWSINNADTMLGKSLTGWSTTKLDNDYRPTYVKVGIISGRTSMLNEIKREEYRKLGILEDWHRTPKGVVFGIHFIKEF